MVWIAAWLLMQTMDGSADLANLALVLVLASAVSGLWLSEVESLVACTAAVMAFNWHFVPPRGTFSVDLRQHAWLLGEMWGVASMVAWLMGRQRASAQTARTVAEHARLMHSFSEQLRTAMPDQVIALLVGMLKELSHADITVGIADRSSDSATLKLASGEADDEELAGLLECMHSSNPSILAMQDVHGHQAITLPLRGQDQCHGATLLRISDGYTLTPAIQTVAQALCDQTGSHLERTLVEENARRASEEANTQKMRNTLLSAISHDYRTPLATILGAASSLLAQSERLTREQSRALASTIVDEVGQLCTMTDNTLQLARLDAKGVRISKDWESIEELIGSAVARTRSRYPDVRIGLRIEPGLPLLRCDAQMLVQLLNNLIDNAVKYGDVDQTVEVIARKLDQHLLLAVGDRGAGIAPQLRARMFLPFERGPHSGASGHALRGAGLGLALCRAIVLAHGGSIQAKQRKRGGTSIECMFPLEAQPEAMDAQMQDSAKSAGDAQ